MRETLAREHGSVVPRIFVQMETANVMDQIYLFQYLNSATDTENKA